jgi:ribonuclease HI
MNTTTVTRNTVGIFVASRPFKGCALWTAYLTTSRKTKHQKVRLIGGTTERDARNTHLADVTAIRNALAELKQPANVVIYTDSKYLRRCITEWLPHWRQNGWVNVRGKAVANRDGWVEIVRLIQSAQHTVSFRFHTETEHPTIQLLNAKLQQAYTARQSASTD